jgi:hypothetical protein
MTLFRTAVGACMTTFCVEDGLIVEVKPNSSGNGENVITVLKDKTAEQPLKLVYINRDFSSGAKTPDQ